MKNMHRRKFIKDTATVGIGLSLFNLPLKALNIEKKNSVRI